jgi:hypothetical protein
MVTCTSEAAAYHSTNAATTARHQRSLDGFGAYIAASLLIEWALTMPITVVLIW